MNEHKLIDDTLKVEEDGIVARCKCGWISNGHFSSTSASAAYEDHKEEAFNKKDSAP